MLLGKIVQQSQRRTAGLQAMGVVVTGPGAFDPTLLPPKPPDPSTVNLDVTTLCALVSEVSNSDPRRPDLQQWAQRVVHWQVGCEKVQVVSMLWMQWMCNSETICKGSLAKRV